MYTLYLNRYFVTEGAKLDISFTTPEEISELGETSTIINDLVLMDNPDHFEDEINDQNKRIGALEYFLNKGVDVNFASVSIKMSLQYTFLECQHHFYSYIFSDLRIQKHCLQKKKIFIYLFFIS